MSTQRQLRRFLVVGTTTVAIDMAGYTGLLALGMPVDPAKAFGFIAGTVFAYFANRSWTFGAQGGFRTVARFLAIYTVNLVVNVVVNAAVLAVLGMGRVSGALAFVVATGCSATLNFLGMKYLVFGGGHAAVPGDSVLQRGQEPAGSARAVRSGPDRP